jgi:signal peptidase I
VFGTFIYRESVLGINLYYVPSESMAPTLLPGDIVVVDSWKYSEKPPSIDEVAVFYAKYGGITYIKRVKNVTKHGFDAEGDNGFRSVSPLQLRQLPFDSLRGKATFILVHYDKRKLVFSRSFKSL